MAALSPLVLALQLLALLFGSTNAQVTIEYLKDMFTRDFHRTCDKYSIVEQYINILRKPPNRYIVFVYSEEGLKNGGIGDRFGGLITATAIALRFNRTLLVESNDGMDMLFQPYFPANLRSVNNHSVFSYRKSDWTAMYNYNHSLSNNDNTEYDLYMCINNPSADSKCGLDNGDVPHPIIKLRGNRAYLCKWAERKELKAHAELNLLGLAMDDSDNLWEAAGCMMRLALWPTEEMWSLAGAILSKIHAQTGLTKNVTSSVKPPPQQPAPNATRAPRYFQVGIHFRCGDHAYLHKQWAGELCSSQESNQAMNATGSPQDLGLCARKILLNHTLSSTDTLSAQSAGGDDAALLFVASDNDISSTEMAKYAQFNRTFISPSGCHIERDKSNDCMKLTASHWFYLSFSDIMITQTYAGNMATSGFSRSAAIYGLKHNSIRSGKNCDSLVPTYNISRQQHGNWFCK